jgi:hypothetical protein
MLLIAAATTTLRTNSLALFLCSPELHKFLCGSFVESIQKKLDIQDCKDANGKQDANGKAFAKQSPRRLPIRFRRPDLGVPCIDCHRGPTSLGRLVTAQGTVVTALLVRRSACGSRTC